ncbi:uncharacterized protein ARMOST_06853 [Armillaria ostoyae]|uniref:Translation machinery-associated protein 16 n=1 Tax=Armillaria ostoyae TaxID=47428 RepID=A0A284R471_ARMOS|nr:uncharacterized protein ARMOST_06853 [Armillaria ostoyae]
MAPSKAGKVAAEKTKKEKIHHPQSRKAGQLARKALRKGKLGGQASNRGKKHHFLADFYGFFYDSLPEEGVLTLKELHGLLRDVWLTRHDAELEEEKTLRRKGRPKSVKEVKLEEIKLRESEEYRTGFEVIDLTHRPTVDLFRRWDQKEVAFIQLLRFIRISSVNPGSIVISRPGKHHSMVESVEPSLADVEMIDS